MILCVVGSAYAVIGVYAARVGYGRFRAVSISSVGLDWTKNEGEVLAVGFCTLLCLAVWPLALVMYVICGKPPKTPEELEAGNERQARYIAKVERELRR